MKSTQPALMLPIIAVALTALVAWFSWGLWRPTRDATEAMAPADVVNATVPQPAPQPVPQPEPQTTPERRWSSDGRLHLIVTDDAGVAIAGAGAAWLPRDVATINAKNDKNYPTSTEDGSLILEARPVTADEDLGAAVFKRGYRTNFLGAPPTDRRHTVILRTASRLLVKIVDEFNAPVPGVEFHASKLPLRKLPLKEQHRFAAAGPNPETAVYAAATDKRGVAELRELEPGEYYYRIRHESFVLDLGSPERVIVPGSSLMLHVRSPMAAVVQFEGDELIQVDAKTKTSSPLMGKPRVLSRLLEIRKRLQDRFPNSIAVVFVQSPREPPQPSLTVRGMFRKTGWHEASVRVVRLADFSAPEKVVIDLTAPSTAPVLCEVTVRPPGYPKETDPGFRVIVATRKGTAKQPTFDVGPFGKTILLIPGRYTVGAAGNRAMLALARQEFDVVDSKPIDVQTTWRKGSYRYRIDVRGEKGARVRNALLRFLSHDGKRASMGANFDEHGQFECWLPREMVRVTIVSTGYRDHTCDVSFDPKTRIGRARAVLAREIKR